MTSVPPAEPPRSPIRVAAFVGSALVILALLAFLAAHASPRVKLLGLFPIAIGALAGVIVARLCMRHALSRRVTFAAAIVLIPMTLAGYATESYRIWRSIKSNDFANYLHDELPGGREIFERLRSGEQPENEVEAEFLAVYRSRLEPPVSAYLVERLKNLPFDVPMPWAAAVAATELLAGWIAGVVAVIAMSRGVGSTRDRPSPLTGGTA